jgi:hypothetical protein
MNYSKNKHNIDKLEMYFNILNSHLSKNNLVRLAPIIDDKYNIVYIDVSMKSIKSLMEFINQEDIENMYQHFVQINSYDYQQKMYSANKSKTIAHFIREQLVKTHNISRV